MRSNVEELERQRAHLKDLSAIESKHGRDGTLRVELFAVKQKLAAVTVDTPHEDITTAFELEASLELRLTRGEAELQRIEYEIDQQQQFEAQALMRAESERHEEQRKQNQVLEQIRGIDDQLSGRKPIKVDTGPGGQDYVGNMARARYNLEQLRERVMQENGLTEAEVSPQPVTDTVQ